MARAAFSLEPVSHEEDDREDASLLGGPPRQARLEGGVLEDLALALRRGSAELTWQAKAAAGLALAIVLLYLGSTSSSTSGGGSPGGASGGTTRPPAGNPRGMEDGAELKWAEDTFGIFLQAAIPHLEQANHECRGFYNRLAAGDCAQWTATFAETGAFDFNIPQLQGRFSSRAELSEAFCGPAADIRAARVAWHFPDTVRLSGVALLEVFTRSPGAKEVDKARWASHALFAPEAGGFRIKEYRLYAEAEAPRRWEDGDLIGGIVRANLLRLNGENCKGFEEALPADGASWLRQSLPVGGVRGRELDGRTRGELASRCRRDAQRDARDLDLQYSSVEGFFPSARCEEVIVFFHKERRWRGTMDVTDDPEALVIKTHSEAGDGAPGLEWNWKSGLHQGGQPAAVDSLFFFDLEGEHLEQEWGWKYGARRS